MSGIKIGGASLATPALLVACARDYLDTPWAHQARLRGVGVDCVGLLICAARDAGLPVSDVPANYSTTPASDWLTRELEARLVRIDLEQMQPGDVLAFAWSLHPWHCALLAERDRLDVTQLAEDRRCIEHATIVHAYRRAGKCIEQALDATWLGAVHSAWRWPEWV